MNAISHGVRILLERPPFAGRELDEIHLAEFASGICHKITTGDALIFGGKIQMHPPKHFGLELFLFDHVPAVTHVKRAGSILWGSITGFLI